LLTPRASEGLEDRERFVERNGDRTMECYPNVTTQIAMMPLLKTPSSVETEGGVMEIRPGCDGHYKLRDQIAMLPTPRAGNPGSRPNQKGGKILAEEVAKAGMLGTPTVDNFHGHRTDEFREGRIPTPSEAVGTSRGLRLQPIFCEWMMGYPAGWTNISKE
jgi:hypothetical protein